MVNWCCHLRSAISDIEVDHVTLERPTDLLLPPAKGHEASGKRKIRFGIGYEFLYPMASDAIAASASAGSIGEHGHALRVFTTRPETILGDVAVAVHPDDVRYRHLIGKHVVHPFDGRELPIIADAELVQMDKGSGVVKITPAHDPNDYACALRHSLPLLQMLEEDGTIRRDVCNEFGGLDRFEARFRILRSLKDRSLFVKESPNPMSVGICSRSGDVLEPLIRPQWYVQCTSGNSALEQHNVSKAARNSVESHAVELSPSFYKTEYLFWLSPDESRDWCISRQLWWGHRVPAYRLKSGRATPRTSESESELGDDSSEWVIARSEAEAKLKLHKQRGMALEEIELEQDPDVLDTWFSSGLLPLSALGWPQQQHGVEQRYPLSVMETGSDILFFWVARMMMLCTELHEQRRPPFEHVYLHPMVRDKDGKKMSKSKGNVIDPLHVIDGCSLEELQRVASLGNVGKANEASVRKALASQFPNGIAECGADALRFALCSYMTRDCRSVNLDLSRIVTHRHFCNKIWNAMRFTMANSHPSLRRQAVESAGASLRAAPPPSLLYQWILSKLARATLQVRHGLENFVLADCTHAINSFFVSHLCDVFIEFAKLQFQQRAGSSSETDTTAIVLAHCVDTSLRLLHPFMPHVSEVRHTSWSGSAFAIERGDAESHTHTRTSSRSCGNDLLVMMAAQRTRWLRANFRKPATLHSGSMTRPRLTFRLISLTYTAREAQRMIDLTHVLSVGDSRYSARNSSHASNVWFTAIATNRVAAGDCSRYSCRAAGVGLPTRARALVQRDEYLHL